MDKNFGFLIAAVLILFCIYLPLNRPFGEVREFKTFVDDLIPLWTPFVIIYISYFGLLIWTFIYFIKNNKAAALKTGLAAVIIACSSAYIFYYLFQNKINRPLVANTNIFNISYNYLNSQVDQYNALPSLHVAISVIVAAIFFKSKLKLFRFVLIWVILIILSTVLTKQHYFLDLVTGLILGVLSYWCANYLGKFAKISLSLPERFRRKLLIRDLYASDRKKMERV